MHTTDTQNAIKVHELTKSYKNLEVLKGISFSVKKGTVVALLGPNGAGKTTTVRILSTLLLPDGGHAHIEGFDVVKDAQEVRSHIGLTGQYAAVDELLTGEENLIMMGKLYHLGHAQSVRRAKELLKQFDLEDAANRPAKTYSGGMKRRLDLALSLVATPPVIFLDEPTTGLDPRSRMQMWEVIESLVKEGATILLTTQYLEEADKLADRILVIDHGRVIAEGTAAELKAKVGNDHLELVFGTAAEFEKAQQVLGKPTRADADELLLTFEISNGVRDVKRILELVEKEGVNVSSLNIQKPTLDDVFLKLTGHQAQE